MKFVNNNVQFTSIIRYNTVQFRKGFTHNTMRTTLTIAYWAWKNNIDFAVEVKMRWGLRADILFPELLETQVIEIMDSEPQKSFQSKKELYNKAGFSCISVSANDPEGAINKIIRLNNLPILAESKNDPDSITNVLQGDRARR